MGKDEAEERKGRQIVMKKENAGGKNPRNPEEKIADEKVTARCVLTIGFFGEELSDGIKDC